MPRAKVENKRISVSLPPDQIDWLQQQKAGISGALRGLITEAMQMDNLLKAAQKLRMKKAASKSPARTKTAK
jgi:hypothetical protein